MKFLVVAGRYIGEKKNPGDANEIPHTYEPGEVVESPLALDKMFANKFRRVTDEEAKVIVRKKKTKTSKKEEDEETIDPEGLDPDTAADDGGVEEGEEVEETTKTDYGVDITSKVKGAKAAGLLIFENAKEKTFAIFDEDKRDEPLKANLVEKKAVLEFVKSYASA